jgi:hypothetical protein
VNWRTGRRTRRRRRTETRTTRGRRRRRTLVSSMQRRRLKIPQGEQMSVKSLFCFLLLFKFAGFTCICLEDGSRFGSLTLSPKVASYSFDSLRYFVTQCFFLTLSTRRELNIIFVELFIE